MQNQNLHASPNKYRNTNERRDYITLKRTAEDRSSWQKKLSKERIPQQN